MNRLRVGIVGVCGGVAAVHLAAYRELECIEVVAGADLSKAGLDVAGKKWGIRTYSELEKMLQNEKLDIACICVPARYHREVAEVVVGYGVHVLIEKPLAVTIEDARAIIDASEFAGVKLYYGSTYRGLTAVRKAREIIQAGEIGEVSLCTEIVIGGSGFDSFQDMGPHHYPKGGPGGHGMGLVDHGIHLIDIFSWIMDSEVVSVYGRGNISGEKPGSEHMLMNFASGAVGQLIANGISFPARLPGEGIFSWGGSWSAEGELIMRGGWDSHPGNFQVYGSTGSLSVYHYAEKLFKFDRSGIMPIRVEQRPMPGNFAIQMESFASSIRNDLPPEVSGEAGLRALSVLLGAYKSFETGCLIQV